MSWIAFLIILLVVWFGGVIIGALAVIGLGMWLSAEMPRLEDAIGSETPRE